MNQLCKVNFRFVTQDGEPVAGAGYKALLYDRDPVSDDLLGSCVLDSDGYGEIIFDIASARSLDSPMETKPDLYLVLAKAGKEVYRSEVFPNVDFLSGAGVTEEKLRLTQDLGTFAIP